MLPLRGIKNLFNRSRSEADTEADEEEPVIRQDPITTLPPRAVNLILARICPHAYDNSLASTEQCMAEETGCVLCDLKDLAQCARVSSDWYAVARPLL